MPTFEQSTATAPTPAADMLAGGGHTIIDRLVAESQTLEAGRVVGVLSATEEVVALDSTAYTTTASGDGTATAFDLGHHSVSAPSLEVLVGGAPVYGVSVTRGTGADGVDQIVFDAAPASGTDNIEIRYQRTSASPAGAMYQAMTTAAGETPTGPVVQSGAVLLDHLVGVPDGYARGMQLGGLWLE